MKNTHTCPKCAGQRILRIPGVRGAYGAGNVIPTGGLTIASSIPVCRYVCAACGFSEEWIDDPEDLQQLKKLAEKRPGRLRAAFNYLFDSPRFEALPRGDE
ncbi:MAG: hypothetical protein U0939_07935 [Pirellulales bacterium]